MTTTRGGAVETGAGARWCRLAVALGVIGVAAAGWGCESRGKKARESTSILQVFSPPSPAEAAAWAVDPFDADKRARGTLLLANAPWGGEDVYVRLYRQQLKDEDPLVQAVGVRALSLHGSPDDVATIVELMAKEEPYLRWECARALQRLHNTVAVVPLTDRLNLKKEAEPSVREAAATALGQYADRRGFDGLVAALDDRDYAVAESARRSLVTLTGKDLGNEVRPWVAWSKEETSLFAGQQAYTYPYFYRDPDWLEYVVPMLAPPNEKPGSPAGMPPISGASASATGGGSGGGSGAAPGG